MYHTAFSSRHRYGSFYLPPRLGTTMPCIQRVRGGGGKVKRPKNDNDQSLPSAAEVYVELYLYSPIRLQGTEITLRLLSLSTVISNACAMSIRPGPMIPRNSV
jgi:hypothetical protein